MGPGPAARTSGALRNERLTPDVRFSPCAMPLPGPSESSGTISWRGFTTGIPAGRGSGGRGALPASEPRTAGGWEAPRRGAGPTPHAPVVTSLDLSSSSPTSSSSTLRPGKKKPIMRWKNWCVSWMVSGTTLTWRAERGGHRVSLPAGQDPRRPGPGPRALHPPGSPRSAP
uniref:Uncharacterized protein n=1 Tax=Varanus komodoensis TaxID=61221 RepID=A0A8D2II94_VARKO